MRKSAPSAGVTSAAQADEEADSKNKPQLHFLQHKAGMDQTNQSEISRKVFEASKNSGFFKKQVKRTEEAKLKGQNILQKIDNCRKNEKLMKQYEADTRVLVSELEDERDLTRTWFHIDMDMFYAAVELLDQPHLANYPIAVGDNAMISTANYIARKFGVRSAMPGFIGLQLCPKLILIKPNFNKYSAVSKVFREIVAEYDPCFVSQGLDEVNMDVTDYLRRNGLDHDQGRQQVAHEVRSKVHAATQLSCSAGIAANRMLAKVCSDWNKPNGQAYLPPDRNVILEFIGGLPVRKMPNIGGMTETQLGELGIKNGKDLRDRAVDIVIGFRQLSHTFLIRCGLGLGQTYHFEEGSDEASGQQKGISVQ